jgi:phosphatidate cytidylyltransferase
VLYFVASYLISKYYIEIAEGKMFIWIIIALIVGVLVLPVIFESKFKRFAGVKDSGKNNGPWWCARSTR